MGHLRHERDVVVDPHAAERSALATRIARARRRASRPRSRGRSACRWPTRSPRASSEKRCTVMHRAEDLVLDHLVVLPRSATTVGSTKKPGEVGFAAAGDDLGVIGRALEKALEALALALRVDRAERACRRLGVSPMPQPFGLLGAGRGRRRRRPWRGAEHAPGGGAVLARVVVAGRRRSSPAPASMSASSKKITGALPPSSRWTRLSGSGAASRATDVPVAGEPVSKTMSTLGVGRPACCAGRTAVADDDVQNAVAAAPRRPARRACTVGHAASSRRA